MKGLNLGKLAKLNVLLYGLRQASKTVEFKELSKFAISLGFVQPKQDYSLFSIEFDGEFIVVLVYIDDINWHGISGSCQAQIYSIKQALNYAFTIKDSGDF